MATPSEPLAIAEDPLDGDWHPDEWWTTTNMGEALPGVLTPLTWSICGVGLERAVRRTFVRVGAAPPSLADQPSDQRKWGLGIFHGRTAVNVQYLGRLADAMPGTSGAAMAEQWFGAVPDGFVSVADRRRYAVVALRLPVAGGLAGRRVRRDLAQAEAWWAAQIRVVPTLDLEDARAALLEAARRYENSMAEHITAQMAVVQPLFEAVQKLAAAAGAPHLVHRLNAGHGSHAEAAVVRDLWRASRDELTVQDVLQVHGCHAPLDGELSSRSWREDPSPVLTVLERYRALADDEAPAVQEERRVADRVAAAREVLGRLPRVQRRPAAALLRLATKATPLRGLGKEAGLKAIDGGRAAARRLGEHLVAAGSMDDVDDVFHLTLDELRTIVPGTPLQAVVAARRATREHHQQLELPTMWRGRPVPVARAVTGRDRAGLSLAGCGASGGRVDAPVRIITDPTTADVEPGEILVAPFTDPGWVALMFVAGGLAVDIGGLQSHAAVVARELGIPCVMGTGDGTRLLRTGDVCRLDGDAGTVEVLAEASPVP